MIAKRMLPLAASLLLCATTLSPAAELRPINPPPNPGLLPIGQGEGRGVGFPISQALQPVPASAAPASQSAYVLSANDLVLVKVYRHDDLESRLRISKDGTSTFPLLGTVQLGGRTLEQATAYIRGLLEKDYLVNPQVTLTVLEYAKRRFTVLGQVQKPGSYEIPSEESVSLLEAIAMAGGFTRLANTGKISISRSVNEKRTVVVLDVTAANRDTEFQVQPDDTITVAQRIF